ncbi:hypothetical protein [Streptomyces sp. MUM 178J]|uniref:hypothetical protein n=1 Tax=Streptomyces sp. MUM 178J TaxID=2791991 RepID=UPI001F034DE9|nr:hypothetical protein [Streptomyces sp. MUM 178J]WRQ80324.1 hypothetical protein I3F59_013715 [Streptomyces sp. MUM 178J]
MGVAVFLLVADDVTSRATSFVFGLFDDRGLIVSAAWPSEAQGCGTEAAVAMPAGGLPLRSLELDDFENDPRDTAAAEGAASWETGTLTLSFSTNGDDAIHIDSAQPRIVSQQEHIPLDWVLYKTKGCGGGSSAGGTVKSHLFDLDHKRMVTVVNGKELRLDAPGGSLLTGTAVTKDKPLYASFSVRSCTAYYEWVLDVAYTENGERKTHREGPFRSVGGVRDVPVYDIQTVGGGRELLKTGSVTDGSCSMTEAKP